MEIGKEEEAVIYEPAEDPFRKTESEPKPERVETPEREREKERDREKVPAGATAYPAFLDAAYRA